MRHLFYEVRDVDGTSMWGGEDEVEAVRFHKEYRGSTLWISEWEGEGEELWQTIIPINVTDVVGAVLYTQTIPRLPL